MDIDKILDYKQFKYEPEEETKSIIYDYYKAYNNDLKEVYLDAFFDNRFDRSSFLNEVLEFLHSENEVNIITDNIDRFQDIEQLLLIYLFLYKTNLEQANSIYPLIITKLDNHEYISEGHLLQFIVFLSLNNIDCDLYKNNLRKDKYSLYNYINIANSTSDSLFEEYEQNYSLNFGNSFLLKNDLVLKNIIFYFSLTTDKGSGDWGNNNYMYLIAYLDLNNQNLNEALKDFPVNKFIKMFNNFSEKSSIEDLENSFSVENNKIMSLNDKLVFLNNLLKGIEQETNEEVTIFIGKLYTDLIHINKELDYAIIDKEKYPYLHNFMNYIFFSSFNERDSQLYKDFYLSNMFHKKQQLNSFYLSTGSRYSYETYYKLKDGVFFEAKYYESENDAFRDSFNEENTDNQILTLPVKKMLEKDINKKGLNYKYSEVIHFRINENNLKLLYDFAVEQDLVLKFCILLDTTNNQQFYDLFFENLRELFFVDIFGNLEEDNRKFLSHINDLFSYYVCKIFNEDNDYRLKYLKPSFNINAKNILRNKEIKELIATNKDEILTLSKNNNYILLFLLEKELLNKDEKERLNSLLFDNLIKGNKLNINDIYDLDNLLKNMKDKQKEFSIRLDYYYSKFNSSKTLKGNQYIFELLQEHYIEILSSEDIVKDLVYENKDDYVSSIFIKEIIDYDKSMKTWNLLKKLAEEYEIPLNDGLKTELFYTQFKSLNDIF